MLKIIVLNNFGVKNISVKKWAPVFLTLIKVRPSKLQEMKICVIVHVMVNFLLELLFVMTKIYRTKLHAAQLRPIWHVTIPENVQLVVFYQI